MLVCGVVCVIDGLNDGVVVGVLGDEDDDEDGGQVDGIKVL